MPSPPQVLPNILREQSRLEDHYQAEVQRAYRILDAFGYISPSLGLAIVATEILGTGLSHELKLKEAVKDHAMNYAVASASEANEQYRESSTPIFHFALSDVGFAFRSYVLGHSVLWILGGLLLFTASYVKLLGYDARPV